MSKLTVEQAHQVFEILIVTCGAERGSFGFGEFSFVRYLSEEHNFHEFRFMGSLGYGGKLYYSAGRLRVACYPENRTPARDRAIKLANSKLGQLQQEWGNERATVTQLPCSRISMLMTRRANVMTSKTAHVQSRNAK
jgi:hypothetical protein